MGVLLALNRVLGHQKFQRSTDQTRSPWKSVEPCAVSCLFWGCKNVLSYVSAKVNVPNNASWCLVRGSGQIFCLTRQHSGFDVCFVGQPFRLHHQVGGNPTREISDRDKPQGFKKSDFVDITSDTKKRSHAKRNVRSKPSGGNEYINARCSVGP
ncbi:hypothetical protein PISMIDRAFT_162455 [Pisolithus microcarpus 441]|uniref:Uncharacterized protein n=1 Tax=Pisolithus microcarpus 441 TaxID=765257 RepID=A0A0C9YRC3_9AGAM|nr:hypothetical protein PISMIDRAFT_162455 [Pisolithus microcarpus 441]